MNIENWKVVILEHTIRILLAASDDRPFCYFKNQLLTVSRNSWGFVLLKSKFYYWLSAKSSLSFGAKTNTVFVCFSIKLYESSNCGFDWTVVAIYHIWVIYESQEWRAKNGCFSIINHPVKYWREGFRGIMLLRHWYTDEQLSP